MSSEVRLGKDTMIVSETSSKGKIIYVNKDFCKISGFSKDELIGEHHNIVRHKDMPKAAFKDMWQTIEKGKTWSGIVKNRCKNEDYYWVRATVYPVTKKNGKQRYISVRVQPTDEEIADAIKLYKTMN